MMISKVRGTFGMKSATLVAPENPLEATVEASVDVTSVDTKDEGRVLLAGLQPGEDRVEIVCGASHPLAKRERVNADDLIGCRWISHPDGSLIGQQMELTLLQLGVSSVNSVVETGSKQVVADLLRATDLVSVLPPVYFKEEFVSGDLTILKTGQTLLHRPLGLAYHAKIASIPAVLMLRRHISEWAAALK